MAITALLGDVANIVKGNRPGKTIDIDNKVFQLHYRFTTFLFFVFSILSTTNSMLGDPINCACDQCELAGLSKKMVDTHCWVSGTYTVINKHPHSIGLRKEYHGIGNVYSAESEENPNRFRKYHMYYQWIPFTLFLQGVLFYMPHWMWEINEDGRVQALVRELRGPGIEKEVVRKKTQQLTSYVVETMGTYDGYFLRFVLCDFLNIVNAIGNLFLTHRILNREFFSYGSRYLQFLMEDDPLLVDPMIETFPKLTKCQMQIFGVTGTLQNFDAICVLALNILNEKIFLILWFWLLALVILSTSVFIFRTLFMHVKRYRVPMFQRRAHTMHVEDIATIVNGLKIGDYFFISLLAKNLDITAFRIFLSQLARSLKRRREFRKIAYTTLSASKRMRKERQQKPRMSLTVDPQGQNMLTPDYNAA